MGHCEALCIQMAFPLAGLYSEANGGQWEEGRKEIQDYDRDKIDKEVGQAEKVGSLFLSSRALLH